MKITKDIKGFTIIELLVVMAISMFVLAAASKVMIGMTSQFKQQTLIAQKGMESGFGAEMLRRDLSSSGYGLPDGIQPLKDSTKYDSTRFSVLSNYKEVDATKDSLAAQFNNVGSPPYLVQAGPATGTFHGSDYMVIRSASLGFDPFAGKYHIMYLDGTTLIKNIWNTGVAGVDADPYRNPNLPNDATVIVLTSRDDANFGLVENSVDMTDYPNTDTAPVGSRGFFTQFSALSSYAPPDDMSINYIYGISTTDSVLRAPFNRVDYYLSNESNFISQKCAPNTGALVRAEMMHADGTMGREVKVMDCVADMQVVYGMDTTTPDPDGIVDVNMDSLGTNISLVYTQKEMKQRLMNVQVYILTHEGQFDINFDYTRGDSSVTSIPVGEGGLGSDFPMSVIGDNWMHYRWRVLKVSERPMGKGVY